jgi:hypothetical protein
LLREEALAEANITYLEAFEKELKDLDDLKARGNADFR